MDDQAELRRTRGEYLKRHTEALVKSMGYARACEVSGRSKATLGRYASLSREDTDRFIPVNLAVELEAAAGVPLVTNAMAELQGLSLESGEASGERPGGLNSDVIALSQRFATLMAEYNHSIADGVISLNEAKRLLDETNALQKVLVEMKMHLQDQRV
ncbi:MAG: hypothetical protein KJO42_12910 [Silicimonas sp.]|nr:hypothetical protein [Silicimonas sp.]MBT8425066.1 hypothetical protein [Silicimonas sp.]NND20457.1 hypothetical protein [Silicimonas sp.]NND40561.1 hypothetical protein [Silicimonas sp.]NNL36203.1 hypothetical protein [Silicimonas sp.]